MSEVNSTVDPVAAYLAALRELVKANDNVVEKWKAIPDENKLGLEPPKVVLKEVLDVSVHSF